MIILHSGFSPFCVLNIRWEREVCQALYSGLPLLQRVHTCVIDFPTSKHCTKPRLQVVSFNRGWLKALPVHCVPSFYLFSTERVLWL